MKLKYKALLVGTACLACSAIANGATVNVFSKSDDFKVGSSMIGAKGSYSLDGTVSGKASSPRFKVDTNGKVKGSFLTDEKTIASYGAEFDLSGKKATLDGALKLGSKTVWSYDGTIKLNKANPFGSYVQNINFKGGQKWVYGALKANLSVSGSASYNGNAKLTYKSNRLDASFQPDVSLAGKVKAKVSTAWTTTVVIGILDPVSALIKLASVVDDGVRVSGATTSAAKVKLDTGAYIDLKAKKVGAKVAGSITSPGAKASVEGYVKYRKLIFNPWPNMVTRTKTFGKKTVLSATSSTAKKTIISASYKL